MWRGGAASRRSLRFKCVLRNTSLRRPFHFPIQLLVELDHECMSFFGDNAAGRRLHTIFDLGELDVKLVDGGVLAGIGFVPVHRIGIVGRHGGPQFLAAMSAKGIRARHADRADGVQLVGVKQHFGFERLRRRAVPETMRFDRMCDRFAKLIRAALLAQNVAGTLRGDVS